MTLNPEAAQKALKGAILNGLESTNALQHDQNDRVVEAIYQNVKAELATMLPNLIQQAMEASTAPIAAGVVLPVIGELEDAINDDHDNPKTPEGYRAGLRRAARTIRECRRAIQEETNKS